MGAVRLSREMGPWLAALALGLGASAVLRAGEPVLLNLNPHGLQINGTTSLVVDGEGLGTAPRLLLPVPARQQLKTGSTDKQATFDVTLGGDVVPGYYPLRVVTGSGVSLPMVIGADQLPQRPLTASVDQLPMALHGVVTGSIVAETRFAGKAGQRMLVEVEAQRLGSKLRPVVHLNSPRHLQLAWSWPTPALFGDARLEAVLPEDGLYTVSVHDVEYTGGGPGFFRLKVGQWSFVDQVFPPVIAGGRPSAVELLGPSAPARRDLPAMRGPGELPLDWPGPGLWSGPRPFVRVSSQAEVLGQSPAGAVQALPAGPVGVSGRLLQPYAEDRYRVPVIPGGKLRLEVFAERYASPLDVALVVRGENGDQLARAEDSPGTLDPALEFPVPDKVTAVVVGVVDAQGRGGPRGIYHLTVDPQPRDNGADFYLFTLSDHFTLPVGGRSVVPVLVERRGYLGKVDLSAAGLPAGVRLEGAVIPEGADGALVTASRGEVPGDVVITRWRGRSAGGEERPILIKGDFLEQLQPWLATEIPLVPTTTRGADFQVDWANLPADAGLVPAAKLTLPVKVVRPAGNSAVRFTLMTSQLTPVVNGQPDPNQALRLEKPVELGTNGSEEKLTLLVPPLLSSPVYDVTVKAELLGVDKKTVSAVAYAPVRRMAVRMPLVLHLQGPGRFEARLDPKTGTTFQVKGKAERREGLTGDVVVSLTGLPAGSRADTATVKTGTTDFAINVVLPPNVPVGEVKGLKLFGTAVPDPKQPNVSIRSREVELMLVVQAPAK